MINDVTIRLMMLSQAVSNTSTASSNNPVLNNIVKLQNQPVEFINLPTELKQKIAFNLDGISYSNLRLTAKEVHDEIPSFKEIIRQLKNRCSGETKEKYLTMYRKSVTQTLDNECKKDVIQCLKYASVEKRYINSDSITIHTKHNLDHNTASTHWNGNILARCKHEIVESSNNRLIPNILIMQFKEPFSTAENRFVTLDIKDKDFNYLNLTLIFKAFNKILNEERSSDRFLVALNALQLKNYLYHNPPTGITKDEILLCASYYPFLFSMGIIAAGFIAKNHVQ